MITINIDEFKGHNQEGIHKFLMLQKESVFEIIIPKLSNALKDEDFETYWEYQLLAYAGQKLFEIADSFAYNVPAVYKERPFIFEVEIKDIEKFADLLFTINTVFNEEEETESANTFQIAASGFFKDAFDDKVQPATWGLLSIANDYLE